MADPFNPYQSPAWMQNTSTAVEEAMRAPRSRHVPDTFIGPMTEGQEDHRFSAMGPHNRPFGPYQPTSIPQGPAYGPPPPPGMFDAQGNRVPTPAAKPFFSQSGMQFGSDMGASIGNLAGSIMSLSNPADAMLQAYQQLQSALSNIDDPNILKQLWNSPVLRQIAQYQPELVTPLQESLDDYESEAADYGLRAEEDEALGMITERARRGDPLSQRIQTTQAQAGVGRALGRGAQTAQELAARRGQPGGALTGRDIIQAGADYASKVGTQNVLAARGDMATAEVNALKGVSGIRGSREADKARALNIRNNYRNALSNRQQAVNMANQKTRQSASDKNQATAQRLHERNLTAADQRRIANQNQRNRWETERYQRDLNMFDREKELELGLAEAEDAATNAQNQAIQGLATGAGKFAGGLTGGILG